MPEQDDNAERTETTEAEQVEGVETDEAAGPKGSPRKANLLSRPTDFVARPGFRNPANSRTKAQKQAGKKRR
ncbi:hypothetical protein L6R53_14995 [Myxococcota bacterium]|nr:hypothetical protein [Myxococcota bacterium]